VWSSPFERNEVSTQMLTFPNQIELRVMAKLGPSAGSGKLEVYAKEQYVTAPQGPSQEQLNAAADLIAEARDYVKEAAEYNDDEESKCQTKVAAKLEILKDDLKELRGSLDPQLLRKTLDKATDTQSLVDRQCPGRVQKTLSKKVGKVVARLDKANAALR
jgi:hypothetical protein